MTLDVKNENVPNQNQNQQQQQMQSVAPPSPLLHKPTATTGGLTQNVERPSTSLRYSLQHSHSASERKGQLQEAHQRALQKHASDSRLSSSSKIRTSDPHSYKIFLLLLQPQSKIFELIQLIYSPYETTVGNILQMIPKNSTEKALGRQAYIGLCRPKTQEELVQLQQMASEVRPGMESARITMGEILVAIPQGFTGKDVAQLSQQILANPKILKLLKRADPLAPKKKKRRSSRRHHTSRSREQVHVLEKHDEAEEEYHETKEEAERKMKAAMVHAQEAAAAANAAIPGGGSNDIHNIHTSTMVKTQSSNSIHSLTNDTNSLDMSAQESLDESYASWSKSFDESFSMQSSVCSGVSKRAARRRVRQARRMRILRLSGAAAFFAMILFYIMDPYQDKQVLHQQREGQTQTPMGMLGIFQCLFLLLTLYKVERLIRTTMSANAQNSKGIYMSEERTCPFLKAAGRALTRFQSKYRKRLKRKTKRSVLARGKARGEDESLKLRSFSLRRREEDDDTGSL